MAITLTNDTLKFRESTSDPWERLLIQANINFNLIYPVGSIYMSTVNVDPGTIFGGTWERLKDKFLLGAGDTYTAGDTGGEATHTLTVDEMPAHTHGSKSLVGTMNPLSWATSAQESGIVSAVQQHIDRVGNSGSNWGDRLYTIDATHEHDSVGGSQAHNNMPPYIVVYMWRRLTLSPTIYTPPANVLIGEVASEDIVPVSKGGTGADNAADARVNLGMNATIVPITDPSPSLSDWFMQGQLTFDPGTNTVRIYLVCRASANITTSQPLGIIPEPYRPKTQKAVFCYEKMNNNSAQLAYPGVVETNGNVRQTGSSAALECLVVGEYSLD